MTILQSIILGIVQGLTEFLPISSSAHLVIVPFILKWELPETEMFAFDVLVQMGTLLAVIVYFWKDLQSIVVEVVRGILNRRPFGTPAARLGWYLVIATIPAVLFALAVKSAVEAAFASAVATALFLWVTAGLLLVAEAAGKRTQQIEQMNWKDALIIGCFQAVALFPGVSRSGATITGAMLRNYDRPTAARFSFLMSVPVMIAAGALATLDMIQAPGAVAAAPKFLVGMLAAAIVGYLSIRWLLAYLAHGSLRLFSAYCFVIGLATLAVAYWRG